MWWGGSHFSAWETVPLKCPGGDVGHLNVPLVNKITTSKNVCVCKTQGSYFKLLFLENFKMPPTWDKNTQSSNTMGK